MKNEEFFLRVIFIFCEGFIWSYGLHWGSSRMCGCTKKDYIKWSHDPCTISETKPNLVSFKILTPRFSLIGLELDMRSLPHSMGGKMFDSLDPLEVRLCNQRHQFTLFTIHESWGSTWIVSLIHLIGKKI